MFDNIKWGNKELDGLSNDELNKLTIQQLTRIENGTNNPASKIATFKSRQKGGQTNVVTAHIQSLGEKWGQFCGKKYGKKNGKKVAATGLGTKAAVEVTKTSIQQLTLNGKHIKYWDRMNDCKRAGYSISSISRCCNGLAKSANGYLWRFK